MSTIPLDPLSCIDLLIRPSYGHQQPTIIRSRYKSEIHARHKRDSNDCILFIFKVLPFTNLSTQVNYIHTRTHTNNLPIWIKIILFVFKLFFSSSCKRTYTYCVSKCVQYVCNYIFLWSIHNEWICS